MNEEPQSPAPAAPSVKPDRTWYGSQILLSDALSVSLLATGLGLLSADGRAKEFAPGFIWSGALSYVLAPAAVHVLHQRPAIAFASASLRASVPVLGAFMGAIAECPYSVDGEATPCEGGPAPYLGLSAGILFASLIDAGLFAYDRPKAEPSKLREFGIAPYVSQDGKRGELRAFGTF